MNFQEYDIVLLRTDVPLYEDKVGQALKICNEFLGKGLYSKNRIDDICRKKNHYFYLIMKGNEALGIYYCYADDFGKVDFLKDIHVSGISEDTRVGIAQSIAFIHKLRGKCIAEKLHGALMDKLFEQENVPAIFIPAWKKGEDIPAHNILERCSCEIIQTVKELWKDYKDLECPACGHCPCICDGVIYMKRGNVNE